MVCCVIGVAVSGGGDWGIEGNNEVVCLFDLSVVWCFGGNIGFWDGSLDVLGFSGLTGGCEGCEGCDGWEGWLSDLGFSGLTGGCEWEDAEECGTGTALNCGWFEWFEWFECC